jgi:hypothetical protein
MIGFNALIIYLGFSPLIVDAFWKLVKFGFLLYRAYDLYKAFLLLKQSPKANLYSFKIKASLLILLFIVFFWYW